MAKKIVYSSNHTKLRTGFGKHGKVLLSYLFSRVDKTGAKKYEIVEFAQGVGNDNKSLKSLPWRAIGSYPKDEKVFNNFVSSNGEVNKDIIKIVNYGGFSLPAFIKEEKPFLTIHCEDPWAFLAPTVSGFVPFWDCEWFEKTNNVIWTPLDSEPIYPGILEGANKIENLWVKAVFAERILKEAGHDHVEFMPALLDTKHYRQFSNAEKLDNRNKYKIRNEDLVFGMVFRNQGRKKPIAILEGFKKFKLENPNTKAKVIFVTNFSEMGSWDIPNAAKELKIENDDVLAVYICHKCDNAEVRPFNGEQNDCSCCNSKKSCSTVGIDKGVTEKQLVEIYNLMDGYIQAANSGGFELPQAEAMFCGIPTATVNYSYGETFIRSGHVFALDFILDRECGSNFKKAVIEIDSIYEFMNRIKSGIKDVGEAGRIWATEEFDSLKWCQKVEEFIDNLPDKNSDFNFCVEFPNKNAEFPEAENQDEWIYELLKSFFGFTKTNNNNNFEAIKVRLEKGETREDIYKESQKIAAGKSEKKFNIDDLFKNNGKKRLMYEMAGDFGDSLISLNVLDSLRETYNSDEWDIYVSCLPQYRQIYSHLDYIAGFIPFRANDELNNFKFWEGARNIDKIVDVWIRPSSKNYIHNGVDINSLQKRD